PPGLHRRQSISPRRSCPLPGAWLRGTARYRPAGDVADDAQTGSGSDPPGYSNAALTTGTPRTTRRFQRRTFCPMRRRIALPDFQRRRILLSAGPASFQSQNTAVRRRVGVDGAGLPGLRGGVKAPVTRSPAVQTYRLIMKVATPSKNSRNIESTSAGGAASVRALFIN